MINHSHEPLVAVRDVIKVYKDGGIETVALRGMNLQVRAGEYVAICGPSGCGKSTLLSIIGGLARPTAGRVEIESRDIAGLSEEELAGVRKKTFGMVFQSDNLFSWLTARENVELTLRIAGHDNPSAVAMAALERVGMGHRQKELAARLSGGERQRVAVATAVATRPSILLADEVTGELDSDSTRAVLDLLDELVERDGTSILAVTHNPEAAARAARQVDMIDGTARGVGFDGH